MKILVFEDKKENRDGFVELFRSTDLDAAPIESPEKDVSVQLKKLNGEYFLFCDYRLNKHQYAPYNGDVLVAEGYKRKIPGLLCSSFVNADTNIPKAMKRYIPQISKINEIEDSEIIINCRKLCLDEFKGEFTTARKPWRTLIRVEEYDYESQCVYTVIPAWDTKEKIGISVSEFSEAMKEKVCREGYRFHAKVNIGCEDAGMLYVTDIEAE